MSLSGAARAPLLPRGSRAGGRAPARGLLLGAVLAVAAGTAPGCLRIPENIREELKRSARGHYGPAPAPAPATNPVASASRDGGRG